MRKLLVLLVMLGACASEKHYTTDEGRKMCQDPAQILPYFVDMLLSGNFHNAHEYCLSASTKWLMDYNAFFLAVTHEYDGVKPLELDVARRLLAGIEQRDLHVDGLTAQAIWSNPEFGFSSQVKLVGQRFGPKVFWGYDFTQESLQTLFQQLQDSAVAWFRKQKQVANGRVYVYPPNWHYAKVDHSR